MSRLRAWVRGLDPPIYLVGLFPPLAGALLAGRAARPGSLPPFFLALLPSAFLLLHAAANVYNDAFDAATPADRFKRHSLARVARVRTLLALASVLLVAGCAAGVWLWARVGGWQVLALSALGVALMFAYHAPPLRLSSRGLGEPVTFLAFGIVPVGAAAALGTGRVPAAAWAPGLLLGLAAALILFQHNAASIPADRAGGKRTLAVRCGPRASRGVGLALGAGLVAATAWWSGAWWPWAAPVLAAALAASLLWRNRWTALGLHAAVGGVVLAVVA